MFQKYVITQLIEKVVMSQKKYRSSRCVERNIVLVGRSRSRKSTLAKVIEDVLFRPDRVSLETETQGVQLHKVATDGNDGTRLYFNIVGTPGFYEVTGGG